MKCTPMEEKEQPPSVVPATIAVPSDTCWSSRFAMDVIKHENESANMWVQTDECKLVIK